MKIACLGWGSLVWKPGALPVEGEWHQDGPLVPIEFTRISDGGELATAACLNAEPVPVLWSRLAVDELATACQLLKEREGIPEHRIDGIGSLVVTENPVGMLAEWARARHLDAVIWTGLPPRCDHIENRVPSLQAALAWLDGLEGKKREHARNYIRQVPQQIDTAYRRAIVEKLGWDS